MKLERAVEFLKGLCRARRVIDRQAVIGSGVFLELILRASWATQGRRDNPVVPSFPPPPPLYPFLAKKEMERVRKNLFQLFVGGYAYVAPSILIIG